MKLLLLYGVNCTKKVWDDFSPYLKEYIVDYVEYPHEITEKANTVEDISRWVYNTYKDKSYDAVIGHSLGGIVALQLASKYKIIFVTEKVAKQNEKRIAEYANVPYPIILPVPSGAKGGEQFGMQGIYNAMEKALGINIFAQEDAQSANKNDEKEN